MISYNNSAPKAVNNVGQFGATEGTIGAYKSAAEYAADAKYWALLSRTKYSSVEEILAEVERLYAQGLLLESDIQQLKNDFEEQNQILLGLIQSTGAAIDNANTATALSKEATQEVLAQLDIISNMTVQTTLLPPGSLATGSFNNTTGVFSFGIPEGQPGRDGTDGTISDIGNVSIGTPVSDDYGFYVDKEDGGLYRTSMTEIANLVPSVRSISINGGEEQVGTVSFNSVSSFNTRTGNVLPASGDYSVDQIIGAAASGVNSDITSLTGLTTALSVGQGGTGADTPEKARTNLELGSVSIENIVPITKGGTGTGTQSEIWGNIRPTGPTPLASDPTSPLDAATKRWVEGELSLRSIQEVARVANTPDANVILSSDTSSLLDGKTVVFDTVSQKIYTLPNIPAGSRIVSVAGGSLTYTPGNVTVQLLPSPSDWKVLSNLLSSVDGASNVNTLTGTSIETRLASLDNSVYKPIPVVYKSAYSQNMIADVNPQGLAEDDTYWYITEDTSAGGAHSCTVSRINKTSLVKQTHPTTFSCHGQGIGVFADGRVFIGGNSNSNISVINFQDNTSSQASCVGLYKDFPFCYDRQKDLIYQLQDSDGTSGNITRLVILSRTAGFLSDNSVDRKFVKPQYPQGLSTDGSFLYITCGNSWSSSSTGAWNDSWYCYKVSLTGQVLERNAFRRSSMGTLIGKSTTTAHEPQAVSWYKGKLSFMQYIGDATDTRTVIFTEDPTGVSVRAIPKNLWANYYSLDELGVNQSSLVAGSALTSIVAAMPDNSTVTFSLSNVASLNADTGVSFGVCTVVKVNANRAYATAVESSSAISTVNQGTVTFVSIYGTVASTPKYVRGYKPLTLGYDGAVVATDSSTVTVSGMETCNELILHITHTTASNPVTPFRFTKDEIDYYVANNIVLHLSDHSGFMSIRFTTTGIFVVGATGSPIVRRVLLS